MDLFDGFFAPGDRSLFVSALRTPETKSLTKADLNLLDAVLPEKGHAGGCNHATIIDSLHQRPGANLLPRPQDAAKKNQFA